MARIGYIKDCQPGTTDLFYTDKRLAIPFFVEEHRFAVLPSQFRKIRWAYENNFFGLLACDLSGLGLT